MRQGRSATVRLFRKKTKWRLELDPTPVVPGHDLRGELIATKFTPGSRIGNERAEVCIDAKRPTSSYSTSSNPDTPPASEEHTEIRLIDVHVHFDTDLEGDEARLPFEVQLPIWMPPTIVGNTRLLGTYEAPELRLGFWAKKASFDVAGLPVHETLLEGIDALGCKVRNAKIWDHSRPRDKRKFDYWIECSAPEGVDHDDAKVTGVVVIPWPKSPHKAITDVMVRARKFPKGVFNLATVSGVELGDDASAWAEEVKRRLREQLEQAAVEKDDFVDGTVIVGIVDAWLS
jgi:hypothetical protein